MAAPDDPFLAAIRANPADRAARLVYADWLEEHNDPRCELIRVCEAMRDEPVWSDRYRQLKARRNELWPCVPLDWLEATGYDGGLYDPIFRSGVRERWRLVREFTERWHGADVPDVGGRQNEVEEAERRLGGRLPESVREFVAYAHDLADGCMLDRRPKQELSLFHCAHYQIERLAIRRAVGLINYTLSDCSLGIADEDMNATDPPTHFFLLGSSRSGDYPERTHFDTSLTRSVFRCLFTDLPTAGKTEANMFPSEFLARLASDFPIHARFDDADVYEGNETLVFVCGPPEPEVTTLVRRPIPLASVPGYLIGTDDMGCRSSGMLGPEWFRRRQEEEARQPGYRPPGRRWMSVLRRREAERTPAPPEPLQDWPRYEGGDDIPF